MYKIKFKLKQHTPLIHFQADQAGATLRASELKPKLDRFILGKLGGGDYEKGIGIAKSHGWLMGKEDDPQPALNYRCRIRAVNIETKVVKEKDKYPPFFGNMGEEYDKKPKHLVFTKSKIDLVFSAFQKSIIDYVDKYLPTLLEQTNFGTRQSKGFGSFTAVEKIIGGNTKEIHFSGGKAKTTFSLHLNDTRNWYSSFKRTFESIDLFYRCIRGGINIKGGGGSDKFYFKSLLFLYAKDLDTQWEKKTIKEKFFHSSLKTQQIKRPHSDPLHYSNPGNKFLYKTLLGLSSDESWFSYGKTTVQKVHAIKVKDKWEEAKNIKLVLDRFKSPVLFKPIINGDKLDVHVSINQKEVNSLISENRDFLIKNGNQKFHIQLPASFSLNSYFNSFLDSSKFDISHHVDMEFHSEKEYRLLKSIFNQIQY